MSYKKEHSATCSTFLQHLIPSKQLHTQLCLLTLTHTLTYAYTPTKGARRVCNFLFGSLFRVTLGEAGKVLRNGETLAPNRTGNLISPLLSSSINLPSGTGAINKDWTLCDTLTGQMGVKGGGGPFPSQPTANHTADKSDLQCLLVFFLSRTHNYTHWDKHTCTLRFKNTQRDTQQSES